MICPCLFSLVRCELLKGQAVVTACGEPSSVSGTREMMASKWQMGGPSLLKWTFTLASLHVPVPLHPLPFILGRTRLPSVQETSLILGGRGGRISALPLSCCVTLGKLLNLSVPQGLQLQNGYIIH